MHLTYISGDGTMQLRMGNNYLAPASATPWHEREVGRIQLAGRSHHDNVQGYRASGQLPAPNLALGGTLFLKPHTTIIFPTLMIAHPQPEIRLIGQRRQLLLANY